ncbi:MAG TPA: tetratricopeptide repeat protein [Sedimentisphaerales bacterium]|nr:tetratricopeptide repeat protein [Sedimentisphaerales bacterium]
MYSKSSRWHIAPSRGYSPHPGRMVWLVWIVVFPTLLTGPCKSASAADIGEIQEQFQTGRYAQCLESSRKAIEDGAYSVEWRILMIESQMALGQYDESANDMDIALLNYPVSMRLLDLGHRAYSHNGEPDRADEALKRLVRVGTGRDLRYMSPADLVALGKALLLLGEEPRLVLDQIFNRALKNDPNCLDAYLAAGDLALAKQDYELAANQYRDALKRFGKDPDVHYGLARAFYPNDRRLMVESLDAALHVNPHHAPSLILMAEHYIDCEEYIHAADLLDRVITINAWRPEAWAYRAVVAHLANESEAGKKCRAAALKYWPENPNVDYLIGRKLSQKYRFADGAAYQRQALKFNPEYLPSKIQLAQDLLRLGAEQGGWTLAEEVHKRDAYNIEAYNLVNLRDNVAKFKTLRPEGFVIRMDELEAGVYGDEVAKLLQQAKSELCKKYGLDLNQAVTVELFANQQDFAVRTFGMPGGEGFLGVCFGTVITANSPKIERPSNWKAMLWHEFCHVVTLNLTHNKMPRWLSEGMSVYEELQQDPTWGQQMTPEYRSMILSGQLTPISELSGAFLSPESPKHLQFAYYESALVVEFMVERFGFESLKAILADLAEGGDINEAISKHTAPMRQIERQFEAFARKRAQDLAPDMDWEEPGKKELDSANPDAAVQWLDKHPNNYWMLTLYAKALVAGRQWQKAKEPLNKLIALYPEYAGDDNAYRLLAEVHRNLGEANEEQEVLEKLAVLSSSSAYAYGRLIEIGMEKEDWQAIGKNGEKYLAVYPMLPQLHWQLGRANEELGEQERAAESYKRLLLLDPADPADIHYRLARLLEHTNPAEAKRHVLLALAEAPRFREAHRLLLRIVSEARQASEPKPDDQSNPLPVTENDL